MQAVQAWCTFSKFAEVLADVPAFTKCRCLLSVTVSMMTVTMSAEGSNSMVSNRLKLSRVHCRHANEFGVMLSWLGESSYARSMEAM